MRIKRLAIYGYRLLIALATFFQSILLLIFRLNWGWQFFIGGKGKLIGHNNVAGFFKDLGLPFPDITAWFVAAVECIGGLLLMAGLGSRAVGLVLSINMTVAYLSVPGERSKVIDMITHLNDVDHQNDFLQADPFFFLLTALLVFAFGSGLFSVDQILKRFVFEKTK